MFTALFCLPLAFGLVPTMVQRTTTTTPATVQGRRALMEQAAGVLGASLILPKPAFADGAVSPTTVQRARGIYGARIAALSDAVAKGDFEAVLDEKNAFDLFNSGAYMMKGPILKEKKKVSLAATSDIFAAVSAKDKGKLKSAYDAFMKNADIDTAPVDASTGQGYATEFDWKSRSSKGAIYQR